MNQIGFSRDDGSSNTAYPDWIIGTDRITAPTSTSRSIRGIAARARSGFNALPPTFCECEY